MTTSRGAPSPGATIGYYDPATKVSDTALVRKLPSMEPGELPASPIRRGAREVMRSHAEERSVYENRMEKERQRQRKELLARMQQQQQHRNTTGPERGHSAPSGDSPGASPSPARLMEERQVLHQRISELEIALDEALGKLKELPENKRVNSEQSGLGSLPATPEARELEPKMELEPKPEDPIVERRYMKFDAEHRQWRDTLTFDDHGRFWRSGRGQEWREGAATAGHWRLHGATLALQWFKRSDREYLQTVDHGNTFIGVTGHAFKITLPRSESAPCPWLTCERSIDDFETRTRVHVLGVPAVKVAVESCEAMNGWTVAREERCDQIGTVTETDTDGTVNVAFEDGFGVWLPFLALEMESEYLERCLSEAAAADKAEEELRLKQEQEAQQQQEQQEQWNREAQALEKSRKESCSDPAQPSHQQDSCTAGLKTRPSANAKLGEALLEDPAQWRKHAAAAVPVHGKKQTVAMLSEHIVVLHEVVSRLHALNTETEASESELLDLLQTRSSDPMETATAARAGVHAATDDVPPGAPIPLLLEKKSLEPLRSPRTAPDLAQILKPAGAPDACIIAVGGTDESSRDISEIHAMRWDDQGGEGYWSEITHARLPFVRRHAAVCSLADGSLLVCGGMDLSDKSGLGRGAARPELVGLDQQDIMGSSVSGTDSARVDRFGLHSTPGRPNEISVGWKRLKNMPTRRRSCEAVPTPDGRALVLGGAVFPGGREVGHPVLKTVECWCESLGGGQDSSGWLTQPDMLEARENFGACCVQFGNGGKNDEFRVVVAGGTTHMNVVLKTAECFDGTAWCAMPSMSEPREGCTCAALPAGRCVVAGGSGNSIELFDFEQGVWSTMATMQVGRAFCGLCYANDHLIIAGGFASDWTSHASVEVLDVGLTPNDAEKGRKALSKRTLQPLDIGGGQQVSEEGIQSWVEQWSDMSEEEQAAFKEAEKKRYRRVQKGTSRGFSRMWDEKLKAVELHKKKQAALKLKAVSAFNTGGTVAPVAASNTLGGKLGLALKVQRQEQEDNVATATAAVPSSIIRDPTPPSSPRGFKKVACADDHRSKQPTVDDLSKRKWRPIAPMPRPRRWLHMLVAALPEPPPQPDLAPRRSKPSTPTMTAPRSLRNGDAPAAELPPVQPKVATTPEEIAALVKQLSGIGKQPSTEEPVEEKTTHVPVAPSAGFGIFG